MFPPRTSKWQPSGRQGSRAMCRRPGLDLILIAPYLLLTGCTTPQPDQHGSLLGRLRSAQTSAQANRIVMEAALIERPVGDPFINQELWDRIDEQVIPLEHKSLIADNGFRVGIISGMPPPGLLTLLTS